MKTMLLVASLIILFGCGSQTEQLEKDGYQVFKEYAIAIKAPCQFQIDSSLERDTTLGEHVIMVCPQIFADTTRAGFYVDKLMESDGLVHHLRIWQNTSNLPLAAIIEEHKQVLYHRDILEFEEIEIDGKAALVYDIEAVNVTQAYIPDVFYNYYIAVTGDSSRSRLTEVLATVRFGEFE